MVSSPGMMFQRSTMWFSSFWVFSWICLPGIGPRFFGAAQVHSVARAWQGPQTGSTPSHLTW